MADRRESVIRALSRAWGKQERNERDLTFGHLADAVLAGLREDGFRVVHPAESAEDCEDPWVCCIHERPTDDSGSRGSDG